MGSPRKMVGKWGGSPQCPACARSVFPAESFMAADRKPFHKQCVKCKTCGKALTSATINEHQTQLYCSPCYDIIFRLMKAGGEQYGGIVTPDDLKRMEEEERMKQEKARGPRQREDVQYVI